MERVQAMSVRPKNDSWPSFYDRIIGLRRHSFSHRAIARRLAVNEGLLTRPLHFSRAAPRFYAERVRRDLGAFWKWLPIGGLDHGSNAYLKCLAATA